MKKHQKSPVEVVEDRIRILLYNRSVKHNSIRSTIKRSGVRGVRCHAKCCPLALYLKEGLNIYCHVTDLGVMVRDPKQDSSAYIELPMPLQQFVKNFDDGKYPELEE